MPLFLQDLKTLQRYQQKVSAFNAAPTRQSMAPLGGASMLARGGGSSSGLVSARSSGDLIKASYQAPLAESLPNSARNTPREMVPDPSAAQQQQQQQYHGLPPGPALSRQPSSSALSGGNGYPPQQQQQATAGMQQLRVAGREGSFRGGLANLAGKMMSGLHGSPLDRLRRLSSGHYQQQASAAQQQQGNGYY